MSETQKQMLDNIVLVGFMGTGKTSVGKVLSKKLKRALVDVDTFIEKKQKMTIREIFERRGELFFRELEKKAVAEIAKSKKHVITTGGGAVVDPANVDALKASGVLVALTATPETIYARVRFSRTRPLLSENEDPLGQIKRLLSSREPYYAKSDLFVPTDGMKPSAVADQIVALLKKHYDL